MVLLFRIKSLVKPEGNAENSGGPTQGREECGVLLEELDEFSSRWNRSNVEALTVWLGLVIIGADSVLFYVAMTRVGWQGATFSLPAFLATLAYVAVLIFVSFVSITLSQRIVELRKEIRHASA